MNIYLTFDYELFVNDNTGDIDHCLIIPTNHLLVLLKRHDVHAVFFIDMAYAYRMKELKDKYPALETDYEKFCTQIRQIAAEGHEIALHLHPQWFYAQYDGDKWKMDFEHYKLSDMPVEMADKRFDVCYALLKEISCYNVKSFRAGGFSIQGYEGFRNAMKRNGLINDSSALFGEKQLTALQHYDYTFLDTPDVYSFDENSLKPKVSGSFTEYPIATTKFSLLAYCLLKIKVKFFTSPYVRWGNGGDAAAKRNQEFWENVKRRMTNGVKVYGSVDGFLSLILEKCLKQQLAKGYQNMTLLGHPKLASEQSLANLDAFIAKNINKHSFRTFA